MIDKYGLAEIQSKPKGEHFILSSWHNLASKQIAKNHKINNLIIFIRRLEKPTNQNIEKSWKNIENAEVEN